MSGVEQVRYLIESRVVKVEEHFTPFYLGGVGSDAKHEPRSIGWFLYLEGSHEAIKIDDEEPKDLKAGDEIEIIIRKKIKHAQPI